MASRTWTSPRTFLFSLILFASLEGCGGGGGANGPFPTLCSIAPSTGTVSTIIAIQGSGFLQSGSGTSTVNPTVTFIPAAGGAGISAVVRSFGPSGLEVALTSVPSNLSAAGTVFDITVANPGGGSATLHNAFTMEAPVLSDINGGLTGSATVGSLFVIDGNNFGDLSAPPASGYSADFRDAATNNLVASTAVNFGNGDWQNILIVGSVPATLASSTTYKVTVTTPSGTSASLNFRVV